MSLPERRWLAVPAGRARKRAPLQVPPAGVDGDAGRHRPQGAAGFVTGPRYHHNGGIGRRFSRPQKISASRSRKRARGPFPAETGPFYARLAKQRPLRIRGAAYGGIPSVPIVNGDYDGSLTEFPQHAVTQLRTHLRAYSTQTSPKRRETRNDHDVRRPADAGVWSDTHNFHSLDPIDGHKLRAVTCRLQPTRESNTLATAYHDRTCTTSDLKETPSPPQHSP